MTLTDLDPKTALLVIDLQGASSACRWPTRPARWSDKSVRPGRSEFRRHGLPIVWSTSQARLRGAPTRAPARRGQAFPDGWTELIHELDRAARGHHRHEIRAQRLLRHRPDGDACARARSHAGRHRRHRHQQRRGIDRQARARARFPCQPARRRHDRHRPGVARAQRRQVFPRIARPERPTELLRLLERGNGDAAPALPGHQQPPRRRVRKPFGWRFISPLLIGSSLNPINSSMIATGLVGIGVDFHKGPGTTAIPHLGPVPVQRRHAAHDGQAGHDLRRAPRLPGRRHDPAARGESSEPLRPPSASSWSPGP